MRYEQNSENVSRREDLSAVFVLGVVVFWIWDFAKSYAPYNGNVNERWPFFEQLVSFHHISSVEMFFSQNWRVADAVIGTIAFLTLALFYLGRPILFRLLATTLFLLFGVSVYFWDTTQGSPVFYLLFLLLVYISSPKEKLKRALGYSMVFIYILCSALKLSDGWVTGSFFLTVADYLPLTPGPLVPIATNALIILQMVAAPLLLSTRKNVRHGVLLLFLAFHLYAATLASMGFFWVVGPILIALYYHDQDEKFDAERRLATLRLPAGTVAVAIFFSILQILTAHNDASRGITFNMFKETRACVVRLSVGDGPDVLEGHPATTGQCDLREVYINYSKTLCNETLRDKLTFSLDLSIDGSPYRRVVENEKLCEVKDVNPLYLPDWVTPFKEAPVVFGFTPVQDGRRARIPEPRATYVVDGKYVMQEFEKRINGYKAAESGSPAVAAPEEIGPLAKVLKAFYSLYWHLEFAVFLGVPIFLLARRNLSRIQPQ